MALRANPPSAVRSEVEAASSAATAAVPQAAALLLPPLLPREMSVKPPSSSSLLPDMMAACRTGCAAHSSLTASLPLSDCPCQLCA